MPLRTGTKCLPHRQLPTARGLVLHDSHAEIHAIRAFNRYLLEECRSMLLLRRRECGRAPNGVLHNQELHESPMLQRTSQNKHQPFSIRDGVSIYLYCSKAPCGDASMELLMQEMEDSTPWTRKDEVAAVPGELHEDCLPNGMEKSESVLPSLQGRGFFSDLGVVRRKPCTTTPTPNSDSRALMMDTARPDAPLTLSSFPAHPSLQHIPDRSRGSKQ